MLFNNDNNNSDFMNYMVIAGMKITNFKLVGDFSILKLINI